jgi:acyl carrier protein
MNLSPQFFDHIVTTAKILGAVALPAGFFALWLHGKRRAERERLHALAHLSQNPPLEPVAFGQAYFPADHADIARRLREILAPHLPFDLARLHPDDRLVEDLRMDALDSMATVEFVLEVEKEFSVKITDAEAARILTLRELTAHVAHHLIRSETRDS